MKKSKTVPFGGRAATHISALTILVLFAYGSMNEAHAQATSDPGTKLPRFDVASVKKVNLPVITPGTGCCAYRVGLQMDNAGLVKCSYCSLSSMIEMAWGAKPYQVSGPDWIGQDTFEIEARTPPGTPNADALLMLQNLLTDRFQLQLSIENRVSKVYTLRVNAGGVRLKPTDAAANSVSVDAYSIVAPAMLMSDLAQRLSRRLDRPVVDKTGLSDRFEMKLNWQPDGPDGTATDSLFRALREELGLELKSDTGNMKAFVVLKALRTPTGN